MHFDQEIKDVLRELKTSKEGLTSHEAILRQKEYGFNDMKKEKKFTTLKILINQLKNVFLLLLIAAGILSLFLGENLEAGAIFGIVLLNIILGFFQEYRAEKEMRSLEKLSNPNARVLRNGTEEIIPARELVPGDMIILEAGDIVPADSRLIEISNLSIDEAALTGESVPSEKVIKTSEQGLSPADQENMAFMGTSVTYGKGKAVVVSTGLRTEFGKIAESLQETKEVETPMQIKFTQLAKQIGLLAIILIMIVFTSGIINSSLPFGEMIIFALALTVSTVPNSLPLIVTISLSRGANRLVKKNMLVKQLPAAESLGDVTVICSDKTGTITKNQMTVTKIFCSEEIEVSGIGYNPEGKFMAAGKEINFTKIKDKLELVLRAGVLCNNAKLIIKKENRHKKENKEELENIKDIFEIIGDPTEGSLIVLGKKAGIDSQELQKNFTFLQELPFDSERKQMSVIYENKNEKKKEAYIKGAPDFILEECTHIFDENTGKIRKINSKDKKRILEKNNYFAEQALRVLAIAYKYVSKLKQYNIDNVEKEMVFLGLVGMMDPPREEVKEAIQKCSEAGIKVMIITGDHSITTKAIAKQIGLMKQDSIVLEGKDIDKMSDGELENVIDKIAIIARAMPIQKLRIVEILQKKGEIVAMTGDGVNDAPALKKADIGIAMGSGTQVSKDVANAVLLDDNFATIVNAVEEGRDIRSKMIKSARYLLSCNAGEILSVFIAIMLRLPLPILPLQILLMNLLTDDFPALGLGFEKSEEKVMKEPPHNPREKPLSNKLMISIFIFGIIMAIGTLLVFNHYKEDLSKAQTMAFTTLVMFQMFAVLSSRNLYFSVKYMNPFSNLWLLGSVILSLAIQAFVIYYEPMQKIFGTVGLQLNDWVLIIIVSILGFVLMELSKIFLRPEHYHERRITA